MKNATIKSAQKIKILYLSRYKNKVKMNSTVQLSMTTIKLRPD